MEKACSSMEVLSCSSGSSSNTEWAGRSGEGGVSAGVGGVKQSISKKYTCLYSFSNENVLLRVC